jgi:hypothetical protein
VDVSIRKNRGAADPLNLRQQAARLETRRNFFSSSEQFQKCIQKAQREHVEKWRRKPASGGSTPDPDTSYETLLGSLDINLKKTRNKTNRIQHHDQEVAILNYFFL